MSGFHHTGRGTAGTHTWPASPERRLMNDGWGCCNTGSGKRLICALGGIGCDVDHVTVKESIGSEVEVLRVCRRIVAAQSDDPGLWDPRSIMEAYALQELRTLHRAVEGDLAAMAAIEDP